MQLHLPHGQQAGEVPRLHDDVPVFLADLPFGGESRACTQKCCSRSTPLHLMATLLSSGAMLPPRV